MDLDLNLSDADEVVEDASRPREEAGESGLVLHAIASFTQDFRGRFKKLEDQVAEIAREQIAVRKIATETSEEVNAGLKNLKEIVENIFAVGTPDAKTKRISAMKFQHLQYAAGPERAVLPLLTWAIIITVLSYVRAMPSLHFWVSDAMRAKMAPHGEVLDHSQGFAMLLFAARNNSKAKLATPPGRIWAFLIRRALRSGILFAKANLFRKDDGAASESPAIPRPETMGIPTSSVSVADPVQPAELPCEPDWFRRFGTNADIVRAVDGAMQKFEGSLAETNISSAPADSLSEGPSTRPRKRKKSSGAALDAEYEFRKYVVKNIRSLWLEKLNHGRTAVRAYLYRKLVFILDKISQFEDVSVAAQNGYKLVLGREVSAAEAIEKNTVNLQDTIWNVPDANVRGVPEAEKKNSCLIHDLKGNFPSLHATVVYKKQILDDRNEAEPLAEATPSSQAEYISVTEEISLHEVANEMLMEFFACEDSASVLSVSQLSVKAIHVLAIALRGLVQSVLDKYRPTSVPIPEMFLAAFGTDVSLEEDKTVSVMMEKFLKNGKGKVTDTYASYYREKFTISEEDAEEVRKSLRAQQAQVAARSNVVQTELEGGEEEDDGFEGWIKLK